MENLKPNTDTPMYNDLQIFAMSDLFNKANWSPIQIERAFPGTLFQIGTDGCWELYAAGLLVYRFSRIAA